MKKNLFKQSFLLRTPLLTVLLLSGVGAAFAGNATWRFNPKTNNWNTATNWTPATIPDGTGDVATFDVSNQTNVVITITGQSDTTVSGIVFNPGASAFNISTTPPFGVLINGFGVMNNSGKPQNFVAVADQSHTQSTITFAGSATAGDDVIYNAEGAVVTNASGGGVIDFFNFSTAGKATFEVAGGAVSQADGGNVLFFEGSSAGNATFHIHGGAVPGAGNGDVEFAGNSFGTNSTAGHANLIADGVAGSGQGGSIFFLDNAKGGDANITLFGTGNLDLSPHDPFASPGVTIGSLQGDGLVFLGSFRLVVSNESDVAFAGVISDGGIDGGVGGSLVENGHAVFKLTNASTYTGGTTIKAGTLLVDNKSGSATGTGAVQVNAGILGGAGTIAGPVVIGASKPANNGASGAFLTPGQSITNPGVLTMLSTLTFNSNSVFNVGVTRNASGEVVVDGVTINSGATFSGSLTGGSAVPVGTVLTLINNISSSPIAGTFDNLQDHQIFTEDRGKSFFRVDYEGGDGNDLTLTRVR
jgi:autotransporter-associated beta strand protein